MPIQTFHARSLQEALGIVRNTLGTDADILQTRQVEKRRMFGLRREMLVEIVARSNETVAVSSSNSKTANIVDELANSPYETVTATTNPPPLIRSPLPMKTDGNSVNDIEQHVPLRERLRRQDRFTRPAPCELVDAQPQPLNANNPTLLELELIRKIREEIPFGGHITARHGERKVVALVGTTGSGKTTTVAKLAAHYHLYEPYKVGILTADTFRFGAVEQLRGVAESLQIPMAVIGGLTDVSRAMEQLSDRELIFLDTPGTAPRNNEKIDTIAAALDAARADEVHLTLPATSATNVLRETLDCFRAVCYTDLIVTKKDESSGIMNILPVLRNGVCPLRYITLGQTIPHDIILATPEALVTKATPY